MISQKYLLITSDDFGMCHAVNAGILRAMLNGVVTSTTLMAPCPWFAEAALLAKKHHLGTGVHLCLTCEWDHFRWGPITHAPSLTASDGGFLTNYPDLVESAKDDEVLREFDTQIARVRAAGTDPTHIDVHMLGGDDARKGVDRFQDLVRITCRKHGLVWIRDYLPDSGLVHLTDQIGSSGLSEDEIWRVLEGWTRPGLYHIIAHAAEDMPELDAICSDEHPSRSWSAPYRVADMHFLTSVSTRHRLEKAGFVLIDALSLLSLINRG
jgi:chitin disaccharide deacetylase